MTRAKKTTLPSDATNLGKQEGPSPSVAATTETTKVSPKEAKQVANHEEQNSPTVLAENKSAGLQLLTHTRFKQVQLRFAGNISDGLCLELGRNFWKFRPGEGVYTKQWSSEGEGASTESARRLFDELCQRLQKSHTQGKSQ